ncbi:DUF1851 domain-containing protein [Halomonas sp. NYA30]
MSYEIILVKILPQEYLNDFLDGNLYMNTDAYFTSIEGDGFLRSDTDEGADEALQFKEIAVQDSEGNFVPIGCAISPLIYRNGYKENKNFLCMYMFTDDSNFYFDKRNIGFGDTAVIIKDSKEFVRRFEEAAKASPKRLIIGPVEYVNKREHHGKMGPFRKFSEYEYQSEFRFVLFGGIDENPSALRFPIGNIRDISVVLESEQLPSLKIRKDDGTRDENKI